MSDTSASSASSASSTESHEWALANFGNTPLGDIRRRDRLIELAGSMAAQPGASLPKLCNSNYATKATYNLLGHPEMKPDIIQANHRINVIRQIRNSKNSILLVEDGTELSWKGKEPIKGLGPVGAGRKFEQGFLLQSVLALETIPLESDAKTPGNTARSPVRVLGLADQQYYVRPAKRKKTMRRRATSESIETDLWQNTVKRLPSFAEEDKDIIRVCDRAADIYEVINETEAAGLKYVIRGRHNRTLEKVTDADGNPVRLFQHLESLKPQATVEIFLRGRKGKKSRTVVLNLAYEAVSTRSPSRPGHKVGELPSLEYTVLRVWEENPNEASNEERIEWRLLTNLPVENDEDLKRIVEIYSTRWIVEDYHKALKTGLNAEKLQLESVHNLKAAVAVMSVVALRLIDLRERLRIMPDAPATESGLDDIELQVLSKKTGRELKTVRCVGLAIGRLGGHLNRKRDGMPGIITLWRGMHELVRLVEGVRIGMQLNL